MQQNQTNFELLSKTNNFFLIKAKACKKRTQIIEKCGEPLDIADEKERMGKRNGESQCSEEKEKTETALSTVHSICDQLN